jgi:5-methylcytosine-specific restriction endonuclease McrBC regulatory subunit McrC
MGVCVSESEQKQIYGVLFNMNYIWEKYLESLMNNENKKVISQKEEEILLKDQKARKIMKMDFYFEDKNLVLDAKYKNCWSEIMYNEIMQNNTKLWTEGRDDIFQILSYMYRMDCHQGGVVAPVPDKKEDDQNSKWNNLTLDKLKYKVFPTKEDTFYLMPLFIPKGEMSYSDFSETMQKYEGIFKDLLDKI